MTLEAVARLAGVSTATVSRVLTGKSGVRPETVQAVELAVKDSGYASPRQRRRRTGGGPSDRQDRTPISAFALVVPMLSERIFVTLHDTFSNASHETRHQVLVCDTQNDVYRQADEILQLLHKRVAGVALVPVDTRPTPVSHIEALQQAKIPVVLLHRGVEGVEAPLVELPLRQVGYAAGRTLAEHGHRRISFFGTAHGGSSDLGQAGLEQALSESQLRLDESQISLCDASLTSAMKQSVDKWLDAVLAMPSVERPTAAFAPYYPYAEIIYISAMQRGVRIPEDLSLVSFADRDREWAVVRNITTFHIDESQVGRLAVKLLGEMNDGVLPIRLDQHTMIELSPPQGDTLQRLVGNVIGV